MLLWAASYVHQPQIGVANAPSEVTTVINVVQPNRASEEGASRRAGKRDDEASSCGRVAPPGLST